MLICFNYTNGCYNYAVMSVTLSVFDAQALSFHQKLGGMCGDPKVIVATSTNPKMVGGILLFVSYGVM